MQVTSQRMTFDKTQFDKTQFLTYLVDDLFIDSFFCKKKTVVMEISTSQHEYLI